MSQKQLILVVDDEPEIRTLLHRCFERDGFAVAEAMNGKEARARIDDPALALITLDLTLGGEDGLELAREIRSRHNVPIIMITGKGDTIDRVVGLELGADDYITKPFQLREVLARVRAVLRRYAALAPAPEPASDQERYAFGIMTLDVGRRVLENGGGSATELTTAEFNLLHIFVKRARRVLSRDNIMDLLKGHEWSPLDRSIDALVGRLRKRVEIDPNNPSLIKTVRGVGYVFTEDVRKL